MSTCDWDCITPPGMGYLLKIMSGSFGFLSHGEVHVSHLIFQAGIHLLCLWEISCVWIFTGVVYYSCGPKLLKYQVLLCMTGIFKACKERPKCYLVRFISSATWKFQSNVADLSMITGLPSATRLPGAITFHSNHFAAQSVSVFLVPGQWSVAMVIMKSVVLLWQHIVILTSCCISPPDTQITFIIFKSTSPLVDIPKRKLIPMPDNCNWLHVFFTLLI